MFKKQIKFMKYRFYAYLISISLIILSFVSLGVRGLNLGLDFTGGTLFEVKYQKSYDTTDVENAIKKAGIPDAQVQKTNNGSFIVKIRIGENPKLLEKGLSFLGNYQVLQRQDIGSIISNELRTKAIMAVFTAIIGILIYLSFRYEFILALGGIIALLHDVIIVVGAYSITYREINLDVLASILVVAGYSITDTVVVFDRIRENLRLRKGLPFEEIIDISINQNLVRTVMTSMTVFLSSLGLFIFGGSALGDIAFAFLIGVITGTLSSIFIASAFALDIKKLLNKIKRPKEAV